MIAVCAHEAAKINELFSQSFNTEDELVKLHLVTADHNSSMLQNVHAHVQLA